MTAVLLFAFWWILAIAAVWKMFRAFRDLHRISESLHWIAHCTRAPEQPDAGSADEYKHLRRGVANSAFGR